MFLPNSAHRLFRQTGISAIGVKSSGRIIMLRMLIVKQTLPRCYDDDTMMLPDPRGLSQGAV